MESPIKYILTWDEAFQSGSQVSGGKGWNLARLARYGFKIPRGIVLATRAYHEFIKYNQLQESAWTWMKKRFLQGN
ncbi:phosphoenolpyruvate synthase [Pelotomaculum sp. FP]|uniref:PEP/pyruvate-binding domain-containing protein n=1 Tax=Pelotomaculum sp. FP TaxID=261474 RepID=UPI0011035C16|nr:phosphoenolpyruvate synthase [Pelotomaculum sp. FP]